MWTANAVANLGDGVTLVAGPLLAASYGLTAPFWCSFTVMTLLTVACWPILSTRAIARARAEAR